MTKKVDLEEKRQALKEEAQKYFVKAKWEKALEVYLQLWKASQGTKEEFRIHLKIGEILHKLNRLKESIAVYKKVAMAFAQDGFLIQAISVCKIVLGLDPAEIEIKNLLSNLYAKRGLGAKTGDEASRTSAPATPDDSGAAADDLLEEFFTEDLSEEARSLPKIPLFSDLNRDEFIALIDSLTPWRVPDGTVICQEGDEAQSMFIIADGLMQVSTVTQKGQKKDLAQLNPGEFFGEIGLFARSLRTATCRAVGDTDLLEIKREDFDQIMGRFPRVKEVLHKFYKERILDTVLAKSPLFGGIDAKTRRALADRFVSEEYKAGQMIIQEDEPGEALFLIRDGKVAVTTQKSAKSVHLATLGPGDFFGEVALISNQKRTASVKAEGPCDCLRLSRRDFEWVARESPEVLKIVQAQVERRVQETLKVVGKAGGQ